jgi:hypothetical protein
MDRRNTMSENPYQVTLANRFEASDIPMPSGDGLFRDGNLLVVYRKASFPDRCIKCNEPTTQRLRRVLNWHLPVLYLLMIVPVFYVTVALFVGKKAELYIPLSDRFIARRRSNSLFAAFLLLVGVVAFGCGIAMISSSEPRTFVLAGCLMLVGPSLWLVASLWGIYGCRVISATYIDDRFAKVAGVCPQFLENLPEWPYSTP